MADNPTSSPKEPMIIRKYANRRLYNTATAGFVTLDDLRQMVVGGDEFVVIDAQTGTDITASILAQIVAEQETRGESVLPLALLKQAISFYEKGMGGPFSNYLEKSMSTFTEGFGRIGEIGEIGRRNFEAFQKSLGAFAPGAANRPAAGKTATEARTQNGAEANLQGQVQTLKEELERMQRRLDTRGEPAKPAAKRKRKR